MKIIQFPTRTGGAEQCEVPPKLNRKQAGMFARGICILILLAVSLGWNVRPAAGRDLPGGFYPVEELPGVGLYRKDFKDGTPDFVLIVDLSAGASVNLLHGHPFENDGKKAGAQFSGPNPAFSQTPIGGYWYEYAQAKPGAFCVLNGQFFYMPESPTPLALPLKIDGTVLTEGFGYPQYPEKQLMLALWKDHADILPLTQGNLYGTDAPDVLGGLDPGANKKPKNAVGRTFMGILDGNGDGIFETVLILATQTATQAAADKTLRSFGAVKVMMLDGGGSTQLVCNGQAYIDTTRILPQAIGVAAAQGVNIPKSMTGAPIAAQATSDLSSAGQASVPPTSSPVEPASTSTDPQPGQAPAEGAQAANPSNEVLASSDPAGDSFAGEGGTVGADAGAIPESQAGTLVGPNGVENSQTAEKDSSRVGSPSVSRLSILAGPLTGSGEQNQAGFIPASAYLPSSSSTSQSGGFNPGDVLWLPAIIPPLSIFILFAIRRRNRSNEW